MQFLLLIVMLNSGQVTQVTFDSVDKCMNTKNNLRQDIPKEIAYVTCVIK